MSEEITEQVNSERLLTVAEFASAIGKTERQVYRYIKQGRVQSLPPEQTGLPGVRISSQALDKFLAEGGSASGGWPRVRAVPSGTGSYDSLEDSLGEMGIAADDEGSFAEDSGDGIPVAAPPSLTVPLERHENAVMRLGYVQSLYDQSQRLLTEGNAKEERLNQRIAELSAALAQAEEKNRRLHELEQALAQANQRSEQQAKAENEQEMALTKRVSDLEASLAEANEQILRSKVKAEVEADSRAEVESRLRQLTLRLTEAEKNAALPWWKRLFAGS